MALVSTIKQVETLACDAGWRNYHFCKITTSDGIVGWAEYDEGFGAPGVGTVINRLASRIIGLPVGSIETVYSTLYAATRPACLHRCGSFRKSSRRSAAPYRS